MSDADPIVRVLERLHGVKATGDHWQARCPGHNDRTPSLTISRGDDGRVLLHCFTGCDLDTILKAAGLETRDLFPPTNGNGHGPRQIIATFDYPDEHGGPHIQVRRHPNGPDGKKVFSQWHADGAGGWTPGVKGVRRVVYRLDKLTGQSVVYVPEGEGDTDRLWSLGIPATTNSGGAENWTEDHAKQLAAAGVSHVVVLPDHDDAGERHGRDVARTCQTAGLTVKIVRLPDLPPKGDVSDWLDAGHTKAELLAIVAATSANTNTSGQAGAETSQHAAPDAPWWQTGLAFEAEADQPAPPMLVDGLIPGEGIALLHADPRTLKTWIAEDVAIALTSGTPALTTLDTSGPVTVLYISNEDGKRQTADRLRKLARGRGLPGIPERLLLAVHSGAWLDDEAWQAKVIMLARHAGARVTILDPCRSLTSAVDKGPADLQPFARFLRLLMQAADCAVILIHHDTKPLPGQPDTRKRAYRASGGGLFSIADSPIHAERVGDEAVVLLYPNNWKFSETPGPLEVRLTVTDDTATLCATPTDETSAADRALHTKVLDYLAEHPDTSGRKLAQGLRCRQETLRVVLEDLTAAGKVDSRPGPKNSHLWFACVSREKTDEN